MHIPEDKVKDIKAAAKLLDVLKEFQTPIKAGKSYYVPCPNCGKEGKGKGLSTTEKHKGGRCFSCDTKYYALSYLQKVQNKSYVEALEWLANHYGILLDNPAPRKFKEKKAPRAQQRQEERTFLDKVLEDSGLDHDDITATVYDEDDKTERSVRVFEAATVDQYYNITKGDDIIIHFYDLYGKLVHYKKNDKAKEKPLFRIRWQAPDAHPNKDGSVGKYKSPPGSGNHLFIPEHLRRMYRNRSQFDTLYVDEGEKKAIKSCKHGMPSVGIIGIHNFAQESQLPHEIEELVRKCGIKNLVFRVDADAFDLSNNLQTGKRADMRPRTFHRAVVKFRDYVKRLYNSGLTVEIYFAYIRDNEHKEKGVDDVLAGSLKGEELKMRDDNLDAMNDPNGAGKYTRFHKISTMSEYKLLELWGLHDIDAFAQKYAHILKEIPEFRYGRIMYRIENGAAVMAQALHPDEQFWEVVYKNDTEVYVFDYANAYRFLQNRGFNRYMHANGSLKFIHVEGKIVRNVDHIEIRDYVIDTAEGLNNKKLLNMMFKGGTQYLGPISVSNLKKRELRFERAGKDFQLLFFNDKYWKISADTIQEGETIELPNYVWADKVNHFNAKKLDDPFVQITAISDLLTDLPENQRSQYNRWMDSYQVRVTEEGRACQFLQYLEHTSSFNWAKKPQEKTVDDRMEDGMHLLSKMWAFGYLLHSYFIRSKARAIIGMDGKLSAIGESQGGTGKSIFGFALNHVIPQHYIDATKKDITEDKFLFDGMSEKHDNCFIDDVRTNFDFKVLFNAIEGRWEVQNKGESKFRIPEDETAKIYLTTNNAINGEGNSYERRQFIIAFSDFYNQGRTPSDVFGGDLFSDWDYNQWNLFYNLAAQCLQIYFKHPVIQVPDDRLRKRRLRQMMGEVFIYWADQYYQFDELGHGANINIDQSRKAVYEDFKNNVSAKESMWTNPTKFKKKVRSYAQYRDLEFNPKQKGLDDKRGSVEYFTIANDKFINQ